MAKDEKETLVVMEEAGVRELLQVAERNESKEIERYMMKVFVKKVEAALRRRCT